MRLDPLSPSMPDPQSRTGVKGHPTALGTTDLPAEPHQVKNARHWLRDALGTDHPLVFEVELLGCELITNSILHSDSARLDDHGRPGIVSIVVLTVGQAIRVEVTDAGSALNTPRVLDGGADAINGRGLRILQEITNGRYGTRTHGTRRTVWFELDIAPAATSGESHS